MTTETTDRILDLADLIDLALTDTPQSPSTLARRVKARTTDVYAALTWMVEHDYVIAVGNGAWTKYRRRNFGERN